MSITNDIEDIEKQAIKDAQYEDKYGDALREGRIIFAPYIPMSTHPSGSKDIPDTDIKDYIQILTKYKVCQS